MISHKHKTIFVHIPKTGGQSVESVFIEDEGLTWDTRAPLLLRRNDDGFPDLWHSCSKVSILDVAVVFRQDGIFRC